MNAYIHAYDENKERDNGTRGKTSRVRSSTIAVEAHSTTLLVRASEYEQIGWYGSYYLTPPREITRTLNIEFTAKELLTIINAAIAGDLLHIAVSLPTLERNSRSKPRKRRRKQSASKKSTELSQFIDTREPAHSIQSTAATASAGDAPPVITDTIAG